MKLFKTTYLLFLTMLIILSACSSDSLTEGGNNETTESTDGNVTFSIRASRGTLEQATDNAELIQSYMIVVVKDGNIVKVLKRASLAPTEMRSVKASLSAGSYKVYAFANIPFTTESDWLYNKFIEGAPMPDLSTWYYGDETFRNGMTGAIPMSNSVNGMDLNVLSEKGNNTYGIEVVRMMAKVEFVFMNSSADDITISKVAMGPLTTVGSTTEGFIPLSWYDDSDALKLYSSDDKTFGTETYTHTIPAPIALAAGNITGKPSTSFYIIESNPDPVTKAFYLTFTVKRGSESEEMRYALLDKSLVASGTNLDGDDDQSPFIRRNDWIHIPIDLGDWQMRLEARSYPPIGGYPEADIDETSSNEFIVTFLGGGDFSIRPFIHKYSDGDNWFGIDNKEKVDGTPVIDIEDTDGLFSVSPVLTSTGEIKGRLNHDKAGKKACVTISLNVITNTSPVITKTLTRKIFITQK